VGEAGSAAQPLRRASSPRWAGLAAMVGGLLMIVGVAIHAAKPRGCVAAECATRAMRQSGPVDGILTLSAMLLITVGALGLVTRARATGGFGRPGTFGTVLAGAGVITLVAAGIAQAMFFDGDLPGMPYFVVPGILALILGVILVGTAVLRCAAIPRWASAMLVVGAAAMLGFNEQTSAVLLAVPFAAAWIAIGYVLWTTGVDEPVLTPAEPPGRRRP
jgi:hypothetical protein